MVSTIVQGGYKDERNQQKGVFVQSHIGLFRDPIISIAMIFHWDGPHEIPHGLIRGLALKRVWLSCVKIEPFRASLSSQDRGRERSAMHI